MAKAPQRFSPAQTRAARGLLDWSGETLAQRAGLSDPVLAAYERGSRDLEDQQLANVAAALNEAGIRAIRAKHGGEGVRFRTPPD